MNTTITKFLLPLAALALVIGGLRSLPGQAGR